MVSFIIFPSSPTLFPIIKELENNGVKFKFEQEFGVEMLTFVGYNDFDVITTYIPQSNRLSFLVLVSKSQEIIFSKFSEKPHPVLDTWASWLEEAGSVLELRVSTVKFLDRCLEVNSL